MTHTWILSTGRRCTLVARALPFVPHYHVLSLGDGDGHPSATEIDEAFALAHAAARSLGLGLFGDEQCFSVLFNGARTRRMPWPHFHLVPARTVAEKHRALLALSLKRWLRPVARALAPTRLAARRA